MNFYNVSEVKFWPTNIPSIIYFILSKKPLLLHFAINIWTDFCPIILARYLKFFNLAVITVAIGIGLTRQFHTFLKISMKPGCSIHMFSNLKFCSLGMVVENHETRLFNP
jgi:hypothetical protein